MLFKYLWDNIAQENYLCNISPERTDILSQENRRFQICLAACFFNRVKYHQTILALFVHCWLGSSFTACGTTMNRARHRLEQLQHHYDIGKRYLITISFQCQYVIGLHRDENPIKNRCRHNIEGPLGCMIRLFAEKNFRIGCRLSFV